MLTKDAFSELFEIQVRGAVAAAFVYSQTDPGKYWPLIRGDQPLTMRDIGDIGHLTGYNPYLVLSENRHLERSQSADGGTDG
jgi:hypothetical protein